MQTLLTTRYTMATSSGRFASSGEIAVLVLLAALAFATPARAQSSDATLSALTVSDVTLAPEFDSATENYTGSVAYSVSQVTVTPTVNESSATVQYLDSSDTAIADADASTTGQQVNLLVGENTIKVKVTAGNGTTTKTYTVKVTRASNVTGQPALSGFPRVGDVVSASTDGIGDPDGLTGVSYAYQWVRVDGTTETNIPGATSETYTLAAADVGKTVKVRVSFTDNAGNPEMATSGAFPNLTYPDGSERRPPGGGVQSSRHRR